MRRVLSSSGRKLEFARIPGDIARRAARQTSKRAVCERSIRSHKLARAFIRLRATFATRRRLCGSLIRLCARVTLVLPPIKRGQLTTNKFAFCRSSSNRLQTFAGVKSEMKAKIALREENFAANHFATFAAMLVVQSTALHVANILGTIPKLWFFFNIIKRL